MTACLVFANVNI